MTKLIIVTALSLSTAACGGDISDADYQAEVVRSMHTSIAADLTDLAAAARELQAAAPSHAWSASGDAAALTAMRTAWRQTRIAYEHVEGATASIFPDFDYSTDARYDDFLARLGPAGDPTPFDGEGATGMHAIERILFADRIRDEVVAFERTLPGYAPAEFPITDEAAVTFKTGLLQRLVDDADALLAQWQPAAIDIGVVYQGLVGLMNEQKEKINLAATGEEESRYADVTLFDLRNNLAGTRTVYGLFRAWIASKDGGGDADAQIIAKLDALDALYAGEDDALPPVPETWSSDQPTAADLATPFGTMWQTVHAQVDPNTEGSIVFEMNHIAELLGFPEFVE